MKDRIKEFALNVLLFIVEHIRVILLLVPLFFTITGEKDSDGLLDNIAEFFGDSSSTDTNTGKKKDTKPGQLEAG